jgi:hypothetical protein
VLNKVDVIQQVLDGNGIQQMLNEANCLRQMLDRIEHTLDEVEHKLVHDLDKLK